MFKTEPVVPLQPARTVAKVLVGFDGSAESHRAVRWALDEADRSGSPVELCYAAAWPGYVPAAAVAPSIAAWIDVTPAAETMNRMVLSTARSHPDVDITVVARQAPTAATLVDRSAEARLLVVGCREHSPIGTLLLSVSGDVAAHAHCPVVVVRGRYPAIGSVVVGMSPAGEGDQALDFAFAHAAARGSGLRVVLASPDVRDELGPMCLMADERLTPWQDKYPGVPVILDFPVRDAAAALTDASRDGCLVVIGARGRGRLPGSTVGPVARHLLQHASCPVAVIRSADAGRGHRNLGL